MDGNHRVTSMRLRTPGRKRVVIARTGRQILVVKRGDVPGIGQIDEAPRRSLPLALAGGVAIRAKAPWRKP